MIEEMGTLTEAQRAKGFFMKNSGLIQQLTHLRDRMSLALEECRGILESEPVPPPILHQVTTLESTIMYQLLPLSLMEKEAEITEAMVPGRISSEISQLALLVIAKQPFPKPWKTHAKATGEMEDSLRVQVLTSPNVHFAASGKVIAEIVEKGDVFQGEIQGKLQFLDPSGFADFSDIKLTKPTRSNAAHVKFAVSGQLRVLERKGGQQQASLGCAVTLHSTPSAPFVGIANESQWENNEGVLIKLDAFEQRSHLSWGRMANLIQYYFIKATRQDPVTPQRPLAIHDLQFIRKAFKERESLSRDDFHQFWEWFGPACRRIRCHPSFKALWMNGLVYNFVTREDTTNLLEKYDRGCFIIRFSKSNPAHLVISYVKEGEQSGRREVSHFLVATGKNVAGNGKHLLTVLKMKGECLSVLKIKNAANYFEAPIVEVVSKSCCLTMEPKKNTENDSQLPDYELDLLMQV
eukprot:CAMPEP_0201483820 /NCGR_PEP_ID=MMETSP0151_2-20130828/8010_1 /ASSEMBLY_ACC=CAM_ASM_000257 /TAXON_ID=200890 /ORGANISM="Paramoeba atlantica, Strain 621/1 / CCAP 1560/9" /LENGTH=463 /DNA_ID=CAMNT_0047867149 /DNA_START=87 /DNA_END=1478 /DNA_ORIENTATION=+